MTHVPEWHREILRTRRESPATWLDWDEVKASLRQLAEDYNKAIEQSKRGDAVPFKSIAISESTPG